MNKYEYKQIDETIYHQVLKNGLNVYLLPKAGFSKTYVTFSTELGSLQEEIYNEEESISLPEGIAHFLEHKLFEQDGKDISSKFAMNQANVNAFTQNNRTTYLFSCTDHLYKNIGTLLDFVQNPHFTEEGITKEIQIITQEIKMYEDDPSSALYQGILKNLYENHPVRNEILGSVESISTITKELLEQTHGTFYHPSNMVLFITGNIMPEEVISFVESHQKDVLPKQKYFSREIPISSNDIYSKNLDIEKEIKVPNFVLGIKLHACNDKSKLMKKELSISVLMDLLLGRSTENYKELLSKHLINDSFGMDVSISDKFGYFLIGSETNKKEELLKTLLTIFRDMKSLDITDELFLKTKKQTIGGFIQSLNSLEYIANNFIKYYYEGTSLFDILEISKAITKQDIYDVMDIFLDESKYTTCTVYPKEKVTN